VFNEEVHVLYGAGTRYMVVDCGGGTVDITVYEMESKYGCLKELHKATGGPYGSVGLCTTNVVLRAPLIYSHIDR